MAEAYDLWPVVERATGRVLGDCGLRVKEVEGRQEIGRGGAEGVCSCEGGRRDPSAAVGMTMDDQGGDPSIAVPSTLLGAGGMTKGAGVKKGIQEIKLVRRIEAQKARVFEAFTTVAGWRSWCCETAECEGRVGGALHIYTEGYNATGAFTELEEGRVVAFTWDGDGEPPTEIRVALDREEDGTRLGFTVMGEGWPAGFAEFLNRTWGRVLDNLKTVAEADRKAPDRLRAGDVRRGRFALAWTIGKKER